MTYRKKALQLALDVVTERTLRSRVLRTQMPAERRQRELHYMRGRRLGVKVDQVEAILAAQDGKCGICGDPMLFGRGRKGMNLDHDRETGMVRGFLCKECNWRLWQFEAVQGFPARFLAQIEAYVSRYPSRVSTP